MALGKLNKPVLFLARREANGNYTIFDVDIFGLGDSLPTTALSPAAIEARTEKMTAKWLDSAVDRHAKLRAESGYVPPIHIWHNEDGSNVGRDGAGFACELHRGDGKGLTRIMHDPKTGEEVIISRAGDPARLYVNFRGVWSDVYEDQIAKNKLPYRSVEILDTSVPDISSVALMFSTPPFFALRPLSVHFDASKTEEAFNFQPGAMAGAHFNAAKRTSVFFSLKGNPMSLKLTAMVKMMRASGVADTKDEAHKRLRMMFAADDKPPTDAETKKAVDEGFAAEETDEDKKKKEEMAAAKAEEDKKNPPKAEVKAAALPTEVETGSGQSVTPPEKVESKDGKKAKPTPPEDISSAPEGGTTKSLSEGGAMLKAKFAGDPPKPEEKKEGPPAAEKKEESAPPAEKKEGTPPAPAAQQAPAAPATPAPGNPATPPAGTTPGAAPASPQAPAMVQPNQPGMSGPGSEVPGATVSLMTIIHDAIMETMQQALAPMVQEVRGMLSNKALQESPGQTDMLAPMVAMRASAGFGDRFAAIFSAKFAASQAKVAPVQKLHELPTPAPEDAKFAAMAARLGEIEEERKLEKRKQYFKGMIDEAVLESNGLIRVDAEEIARTAAEMPVRKAKMQAANGELGKEVEYDLGREHVRQILAQAGATLPPPPVGFSAEDGAAREGLKHLDPDVAGYAGHNKALGTAQAAAKIWDDTPKLQKMTARKTYITSEVFVAHKVEPKAK